MHQTWSKHSIRLIQISQPPKFIRRGHCSICFLTGFHTEYSFCSTVFRIFIFFYKLSIQILSTSQIPPPLQPSPSPAWHPQLLTPKQIPLSSLPAAEALLLP